jgi:ribonucleoside-triphosphate reductase (thioredoxin)
MNIEQEILSDIIIHLKYSKYLPEHERRETWSELVDRNKNMHIEKFPHLLDEIEKNYQFVYDRKVLPSMRSMQFAGRPIAINNARIYNCCYLPIDDHRCFSEIMFLLLSGTGVGYSVQYHHIEKLPEIKIPTKTKRYLIGDSIEGWADSVRMLMKAYLTGIAKPEFDFRDIRPKGARLVTAGGKAPGPEPLKECLFQIQKILDRKQNGDKLTSVECHDIICHIADAVLSGGIRRAALIALFDIDDEDMLTCKFGNWWEENPQRGRANNSAMILRHKIKKKEFLDLWKKVEASNSGEPGIYFSNDKDSGTNPCCEISLRPYQFCNLCELNVSDITSQEDLNERAKSATFIGTLQASYTNFHYLRDIWKKTTEKDALIGVGMTGIASGAILNFNLEEAANIVKQENERVAKLIGINKAARTTTIKPSGTSSLVLGTSSGIHAWHDNYYIRRVRIGKNESLYTYLLVYHNELLEDDYFKPNIQSVVSIPQKSPEGSILRTESALNLLERVKKFNIEWVKTGHRKGENTNNVSATISIKENEWEEVGEWMWKNKEFYNGLSVLPYDGHTYTQAPFENITKEVFDEKIKHLHNVDLTKVIELQDNTEQQSELACAADGCEIK